MWLIGGVIAAGIIGGIVYLFNEIQEKAARIDALGEQCREKDAEIQSLNEKCNTLTKKCDTLDKECNALTGKCDTLKKECRQRDETIATLCDENDFLNKEILKYNTQWQFRSVIQNLAKDAYRVNLDD